MEVLNLKKLIEEKEIYQIGLQLLIIKKENDNKNMD